MFDDELTVVEDSFQGLGQARAGVVARGGRADERTLTLVLQSTERLRRAADALELAVIGQSARWGEERGPDGIHRPVQLPEGEVAEFAPEAVAMATQASAWEAGQRCDLAARAVTDLSRLADLVAQGRLRVKALAIVAKETKDASPEAVTAIVDHLLGELRGRPGSIRIEELEDREIRKAVRRMLQRVEPELLREKAERNRREKLDVRFSAGPVGTAEMFSTMPTEIAVALKEAIEEAAARRRVEDPKLSLGAARVHGLADLALLGVELQANVRIGIPVITSAASRLSFAPYEGGEGLEAPSSHLDQRDGRTSHLDEDRVAGRFVTGDGPDAVEAIPEECFGPGVTSQVPTTFGPGGQEGWISGCEIPGVGFIPADVVARLVTNLETRVSRALIDARTGTLVETANPRYVVTESMREFVTARDQTCRMWGCDRAIAQGCARADADLDHAKPWPEGATCPSNLSGLCRHHHRLKHSTRWTHTLHEDGRTEWVSPSGVSSRTYPAMWAHTDEVSPPPEGANGPSHVMDLDEELDAAYADYAASILPPSEGAKEEQVVDVSVLFHPNFHGPVAF